MKEWDSKIRANPEDEGNEDDDDEDDEDDEALDLG
jgi:hypothetical protein